MSTLRTNAVESITGTATDFPNSLKIQGTLVPSGSAATEPTSRFPYVVGSVAELREGGFPAEVNSISLLGYYGKGTAGGGPLYRDSADTATADNGGTVFVDGDGVRWKRPEAEHVSVALFGARGDGATDDTVAIQGAIDSYALVVDGGNLNYSVSTPISIPSNKTVQNIKIVPVDLFAGGSLFSMSLVDDITFNGLWVDGAAVEDVLVFSAEDSNRVRITDFHLQNLYAFEGSNPIISAFNDCSDVSVSGGTILETDSRSGFRFNNSTRCVFDSITADNVRGRIVSAEGSSELRYSNVNIGTAYGQGSGAAASYAGEIYYMNGCSDSVISGLTISTLLQGGQFIKLSRGCSFIKVSDCHCYDIYNYSTAGTIRIEGCFDVDVNNCSINATDRGGATTYTALITIIPHESTEFSSSRVHIKNCTLIGDARGIQVNGSSVYPVNNVSLISNYVDVSQPAIRVGHYVTDLFVTGGIYRSAQRIVSPITVSEPNGGTLAFQNVTFDATGVDNRYFHLQCEGDSVVTINNCSVVGKSDVPDAAFVIQDTLSALVFTNNIYYPNNTSFGTISNNVTHNNFGYSL